VVRDRPAWRARAEAGARAVSLILAGFTALALIAVPFLAAPRMTAATHGMVSLILMGMSAGFVHGLGMRPAAQLWRLVFSAWTAWPLIVLGWLALLAHL
jgi:predicted membrane protein